MGSRSRRLVGGGLVALIPLVAAIVGLVAPRTLGGAAAWSVTAFAVLWGWGGLARRYLRVELGAGEQLLLGTVAWVTLSGLLLAVGHASRGPLFVLATAGLALSWLDLYQRIGAPDGEPAPQEERLARVVLGGLLAIVLGLNLLATIGTRGNPYDDYVAYTAFTKRLLDCGNLIEPFSFRRLSAYGGQTALHALAALRGDVDAIDMLDRGIYQIVVVLLLLDIVRRRRIPFPITVILVGFVLTLWDLSANSAASWSGFACFLGAYGFASRDDLDGRTSLAVTAAIAATACTLRQNYLATAGLFVVLLFAFQLRDRARDRSWREAWRAEWRTIAIACGVAAVVVGPYMLATWRDVGTPLYPILHGTFNPSAPLRPAGATWLDEVLFFAKVCFSSEPIHVWWLLVPLMLLARDTRTRRPWPAFALAALLGFVFTVHSFMLSDAYDLWRYTAGYMTPLAVIFFVEAAVKLPGIARDFEPPVRLPAAATLVAMLAMAAHFVESRSVPNQQFVYIVRNLQAGMELGTAKVDPFAKVYRDLQAAMPEGATVAVMLDEPQRLDYRRNKILNLDIPGFAAPAPGLPSFTDAEHWRAYFTSHGIRYLAFVDGMTSTYMYRREGWRARLFDDDELYRFLGVHIVDTDDAFSALAKSTRVMFHEDGHYLLDLGPPVHEADRGPPELVRQDRFIRELSERELGTDAWELASRSDVVFVPGQNGPTAVVPLAANNAPIRGGLARMIFGEQYDGLPHRWLSDRSHVRVHGTGRMRLHVKLWIKTKRLYTVPAVELTLDGQRVAMREPDSDGDVSLDGTATCNGWCDVYLRLSSMPEWWLPADGLRAIELLEFTWDPVQ